MMYVRTLHHKRDSLVIAEHHEMIEVASGCAVNVKAATALRLVTPDQVIAARALLQGAA
jgi:hypothetical protein